MTEEIAKKASKLIKTKEDLKINLLRLEDKYCYIALVQDNRQDFGLFRDMIVEKYSEDIQNKLKELLISEINEKINKIDKELSELKCN